jgi:transcriptional regulator with XRE-family HTH domain
MQAKQLNDHELVHECMVALCEKAGFPDTTALVQRDLQTLADAIEARTGVLISLSTIKRLLAGQFSRLPQIATLNALAQYLDYPHWQAFRIAQKPAGQPAPKPATDRRQAKRHIPRVAATIALVTFTTLALLAVKLVHHPLANLDKTAFSATKVTGNDIPNSVVFHYNIDTVMADSFFIQQSWDRSRRVRIYKKNYTLTDIYYEPGYHTAKLYANDKIIKTVPVSIPTNGWVFYAREELFKGRIAYIPPSSPEIKNYNAFIWVDFPAAIQYTSDDFTLKVKIKVNNVNNASCPFLMTEIFCQHNFMYFQNRLKGCSSESFAQFGDNFLNGKTHDLSGLGMDITTWQKLSLTVKDRKATVSINGVPAYSATYQASGGLITGLGFISNGLCDVDSVDLRTGDGKPIITSHPPSAR